MTKNTNLILIGGGTSCIEIIDLINDINKFKSNKIYVAGILDDNIKLKNKKISNVKVLGKINLYRKYLNYDFF